jgi:hypothetical protein
MMRMMRGVSNFSSVVSFPVAGSCFDRRSCPSQIRRVLCDDGSIEFSVVIGQFSEWMFRYALFQRILCATSHTAAAL